LRAGPKGAAADSRNPRGYGLWYRSGIGRGLPSADGQRFLVQLSSNTLGGMAQDVGAPEIQPAREQDLPALVQIYNHYVTATHITFDTQPFTAVQRRAWFDAFSLRGPHRLFVAAIAERVVGYASSTRFRPKPAYDQSVETSIYLHPDFVGQGIGRPLYAYLLDAIGLEPSVHRAYGAIALPNPASIVLHERLGFKLVGTFREVGFKFEKYWHVSWFEKDLSRTHAA